MSTSRTSARSALKLNSGGRLSGESKGAEGLLDGPKKNSRGRFKKAVRAVYSSGDYRQIAAVLDQASARLVESCEISAGDRVLDVACGTGNAAIRAARSGAEVTALDLTPKLLHWGRARADAAGLNASWVAGDAEQLPFPDGLFDCVTMVFAAFMVPSSQALACQLFRVAAKGGTVGMVNWADDGFVHRVGAVAARHLPKRDSAPGRRDRFRWGNEAEVASRLEPFADRIEFKRLVLRNEYDSFEAYQNFQEANMGAMIAARQVLKPGQYETLLEELKELIGGFNLAEDGRIVLDSEYLMTLARSRSRSHRPHR